MKAIYPGTFDPITNGHLDVIVRASKMFENLLVGIGKNPRKTPLFGMMERFDMVQSLIKDMPNVVVVCFEGLLVNYARKMQVEVIVRGLRVYSDFETEFQMALANRTLAPEIETVFLTPRHEHSYISSSVVREVAAFKGNVANWVPDVVLIELNKKFQNKGEMPESG